eukprot:CAMPEP_0118988212 /NCGR_PEP_ID=MMETSP1173-20130426/45741_1 /TAXON_ID=1034831 /ORGANISM="Rhizochromulina marina cf, Strain CCMP1243" /LENGTH=120 /DNA_ID=CAMNT_0006939127 /DNA_START=327 /DNA_END=689 /DNA_ORIENTATION=+
MPPPRDLQGSQLMRRQIAPSARFEMPLTVVAQAPSTYTEYSVARRQHAEQLRQAFKKPRRLEDTKHFRTNTKHSSVPFCLPGVRGTTNCSGWAQVLSTEGVHGRPPFLLGGPFATSSSTF